MTHVPSRFSREKCRLVIFSRSRSERGKLNRQPPAATAGFCHLHVHTHYSALDGACKVDDLVARAAEMGMPALAITDHGVLSGIIQFYQQCRKAGVKPIIGLEAYVVEDRFRKEGQNEERWHLTLLAENETGYRNLLKLGSLAFLEGYYYKPRMDYSILAAARRRAHLSVGLRQRPALPGSAERADGRGRGRGASGCSTSSARTTSTWRCRRPASASWPRSTRAWSSWRPRPG